MQNPRVNYKKMTLYLTDPFLQPNVHWQVHGDGRPAGAAPPLPGQSRMLAAITVEILESAKADPEVTRTEEIGTSVGRLVNNAGKELFRYTQKASGGATFSVTRIGPNSVQIDVNMSGSVPWLVGGPQPSIDFSYSVSFMQCGNKVSWFLKAQHDGFPAHESFIESAGVVKWNKSYVPTWFAAARPGTVAYPSVANAILGALALAGEYRPQNFSAKGSFTVP
jgi:hypothetical protein